MCNTNDPIGFDDLRKIIDEYQRGVRRYLNAYYGKAVADELAPAPPNDNDCDPPTVIEGSKT